MPGNMKMRIIVTVFLLHVSLFVTTCHAACCWDRDGNYYGRFRLRAFWFQLIGDFADLCPPRSRCSATCGTLFALHYDIYTIGAGGHPPRFAIGSRGIEVSSSKVSTFLTFADLCPPRSRCSATRGTLFALHYDVYTIGAGGNPLRLSLQYAGVPLRGVQSQSIFT